MNHLANSFDISTCEPVLGAFAFLCLFLALAWLPGVRRGCTCSSAWVSSRRDQLSRVSRGRAKALLSCALFFFSSQPAELSAFPWLGSIKGSRGTLPARALPFPGCLSVSHQGVQLF